MTVRHPTVLVILDGFGYRPEQEYNAIAHAYTPHLTDWFSRYPHALLNASGTSVGLPAGSIGNSLVGHMTIGSGRIIPQPITVINAAIADKSFFNNQIVRNNLQKLVQTNKKLHLMGLLSDANIHSNQEHLYAFLQVAARENIETMIHAFLDGRDVPPQSAASYLQQLDQKLQAIGHGILGSIHGRFYAMDRDNNWDRTEQTYRVLTQEQEINFSHWQEALQHYYDLHIFDEFIPPTQLNPLSIVQPGDGIIFFNVRPDRARQLTACFVDLHFDHFRRKQISLSFFITPTSYDDPALQTTVLYPSPIITNTLKDVLAQQGKTIFSIAETEKYAHVTYFFNGGRENLLPHEKRVLIPSLPAKNYIHHPEMSAQAITKTVLKSLTTDPCDFYLINYANADMVGHSGNFDATVKAIECLDQELKKLYDQIILEMNGTLYITADHGKAEDMYDTIHHQLRTAHTTSQVPFIMIRQDLDGNSTKKLPLAQLADIAPFILHNLDIPVPSEMIHHF
jgi:2,3-bisphosphoglycerate-independent phosphoglycerate mutase